MPHRVGVLLFPGVTLLDVAGPAEVFSEANRYGADYRVITCSTDGRPVRSSTGIQLAADAPVSDVADLDTVVLPGSEDLATLPIEPDLVRAAGQLARGAGRVASICTGAFLLAATGRLDGRRATTHWRHGTALARRHPRVTVELDAIFVADGPIATSAGVTAGIDLALAMVERDHGPELTRDVAKSLVVFLQRPGGQSQFSAPSRTPRPRSQPLRALLDAVAADPAGRHSVPRLAAAAGMSPRHLTRLFRSELGVTPARYVERMRLEAAQLLLEAGHSVGSAAERSGFGSDESLRRAFVTHLGIPPAAYRRRFASTHPGG
ncbi:GlxA family transcriptional regulator [Pseudonocardia eucalypti]|uniref:GlxA family transcriptional regulator n=1 Tax=Pseudonocardia eucalypti TaxID=648755 RepID=A0ABP9PD30_9PSEU|nr:transcriptional regulator GlxA family with amidase domain [Pseudonocardia eucalypti]